MSATDALLQELQQVMECQLMSDLHASWRQLSAAQRAAVLSIPAERYTLQEWNGAVAYIVGKKCQFHSVADARRVLCAREQYSK